MKKSCGFSILVFPLFLGALQFGVSSCTKEVIKTDTVNKRDTITVIKKDTLVIKDTPLTMQVLTANAWESREYKGIVGGKNVYYLRGGTNNTETFDNEYIVFKSDKTGTYYDNYNNQTSLTWDFANANNTAIVYTLQFAAPPGPTVVKWENIRYQDGSLNYTQAWTQDSVNSYTYNIRIPK